MKELSITFKAEITEPFDVEEFSVRLLHLITSRVPRTGGNACVGTVRLTEPTVTERHLGLNMNGFVQNGSQERLIPETPNGFKRVLENNL